MHSGSRAGTLSRTVAAALVLAATTAVSPSAQAQAGPWGAGAGKGKSAGHYAEVNGIRLYYEIGGSGRPLILLHGGLGAIEMFGPNLPALAKGRRVIAVDLQGHGRTADINRPLSVELMADDIAALIKHLKLERPDVMGYSLGGGVALQTAIRHPEVVGKLVVVSAVFRRNGYYPEILAQQGQVNAAAAEGMKQTPMYQLYSSIGAKAGGLAAPPDQDRPGDEEGLRLLQRDRRYQGDNTDRRGRCRHLPARARGGDVRAARRRQARRGVGWFRAPEVEARHSAGSDALHHLQRSGAGGHGHPVPRRTGDCGPVIQPHARQWHRAPIRLRVRVARADRTHENHAPYVAWVHLRVARGEPRAKRVGEEVHTPEPEVATDGLEVLDEVASVEQSRVSGELRSPTTPLVVVDDDVPAAKALQVRGDVVHVAPWPAVDRYDGVRALTDNPIEDPHAPTADEITLGRYRWAATGKDRGASHREAEE